MSDLMSDEEMAIAPLPPHYGQVDAANLHGCAKQLQAALHRALAELHAARAVVEAARGVPDLCGYDGPGDSAMCADEERPDVGCDLCIALDRYDEVRK